MSRYIITALTFLALAGSISSCYYDNEEELYPGAPNGSISFCDTAAYTYALTIQPIIVDNCNKCHSIKSATSLGGNIVTEGYANLKVIADNGKLYGSITHNPKYSAMPKSAAKLTDCEITYISRWVADGEPNN
jgi:hypothetical protein